MKKNTKISGASDNNQNFEEMKCFILEKTYSNGSDVKTYEKIDPCILSNFARKEGLSLGNELILGGRRIG